MAHARVHGCAEHERPEGCHRRRISIRGRLRSVFDLHRQRRHLAAHRCSHVLEGPLCRCAHLIAGDVDRFQWREGELQSLHNGVGTLLAWQRREVGIREPLRIREWQEISRCCRGESRTGETRRMRMGVHAVLRVQGRHEASAACAPGPGCRWRTHRER